MSISHLEVQIIEHRPIVHQVEAVVHIVALLLGQDECVLDQFLVVDGGGEVVEGVAGLSGGGGT